MKPIVLAISGGADSVYLLHQLLGEDQKPILAHFNHQLRGKESDTDEQFVRELGKKHELKVEVGTKNVKKWAKTQKKSLEESGRILRYEFLENVRQKHGASEIFLAHHLNDNLETVLMNKLRGCELRGRIGMREKNGHLIRPLLNTPKSIIVAHLKKHQTPYREDASNKDTTYLRNWVRHELIPELLKKNPSLLKDFQKNREAALKSYEALKKWATTWFAGRTTLSISEFLAQTPEFQRFLLQHLYEETYGSTLGLKKSHIKSICRLIQNNVTGKCLEFGPTITLRTEYNQIIIESHTTKTAKKIIDPKTLPIAFDRIPGGILKTRTWRPGDRFQPSGMTGTKKLQDYFVDAKIPRLQRGQIPIFTTKEGHIVAVGTRIDERFRKAY